MELAERLQKIIKKHDEIIDLVLRLKDENKQKDEQIINLQKRLEEVTDCLHKMYKFHADKLYGRTIKDSSR